MSDAADKAARQMTTPPKNSAGVEAKDLLGTGSTVLNLACSGRWTGGFPKGTYVHLVGDSDSGKSFLSMTCMAEASQNKHFDDYRFVYDPAENGVLMDVAKFFGKAVAERLEPPTGKEPGNSTTVEEFGYHCLDALREGPCVYVLDTFDALSSDDDKDQLEAERKEWEGGKAAGGSYGMAKAKKMRATFREIDHRIKQTGSVLVVISQALDNVGVNSLFKPKTFSGGKALKSFCRLQLWTSVRKTLTAAVKGKDYKTGAVVEVKVAKNHVCGWVGSVEVPYLIDHGIDDVGGCVAYLTDVGHWKGSKGRYDAPELGLTSATEEQIVQAAIPKQRDLRKLVARVWADIGEQTKVRRPRRYE